ncbi:MAG: sulfite exporter TauE/SafE family protein [Erysipelotrichaceae bacterium]|jgi:sulfite exporter TauE/SafE/copper chaperone CopZ|nr:sulfite exporter TauE/SafE family protein [Erysipelotrichaceae bacterium]
MLQNERIRVGGMTCVNCQEKIAKTLRATPGIKAARVKWEKEAAVVVYDPQEITRKKIEAIILALGYEIPDPAGRKLQVFLKSLGIFCLMIALFILLQVSGLLNKLAPAMVADSSMSMGMLFVIGLLTSVHCVAMCGGLNLSSTLNYQVSEGSPALRAPLLYNMGRLVSYTMVGFLVGALGSVLTLSPFFQGLLKLFAGIWMVIMGCNLLGIFPVLRYLTPRFARINNQGNSNPLIIGLLNGLMPCGPLQSMQLYALSTGSALMGGLSMFLFALGTIPLMFFVGVASAYLKKQHTKVAMAFGAILVAVLGFSMLSQGWALLGLPLPNFFHQNHQMATSGEHTGDMVMNSNDSGNAGENIEIIDGKQYINSTMSGEGYPAITVLANVPVVWSIEVPEGALTGCNKTMIIQEYDIEYELQVGTNVIEFTPTKTGEFTYTCWMGMITSTITVIESESMQIYNEGLLFVVTAAFT